MSKLRAGQLIDDCSNLHWNLASPKGQRSLIEGVPFMHYALPTFLNRKAKASGVDHCLFWRDAGWPNVNTGLSSAWYESNRATRNAAVLLCRSPDAARWGQFVENLTRCSAGTLVKSATPEGETLEHLFAALTDQVSFQGGSRVLKNDLRQQDWDV